MGEVDADLLQLLKDYARCCWRLFGLRGWVRVDFRIDEKGQSWVLELNANPCLALGAGFMAAGDKADRKPELTIDFIVKNAFSTHGGMKRELVPCKWQ